MEQNHARSYLQRWMTVLMVVVIGSLIISACAAPAAAPIAQAVPTQVPAVATQAPAAATQAPAATEAPTAAATQPPAASSGGAVSFSKDVVPIFEKSCSKCHGGSDGKKGGLDLGTYESMMQGGQDGQVIVPGDAAKSILVKLINEGKMPKRAPKLAQEQIDLIAEWVSEGALKN
jgi:mono/diheme cytochrome c family protein